LGSLGKREILEEKEFPECWHSSKLFLELEENLKLRGIAKEFLRLKVGDVDNIHLWLDL
jgi:hypothetical protein